MRVHLAGTRAFGAAVLAALLEHGHEVTGVTAPPPSHRAGRERPDLLATAAAALGHEPRPDLTPACVAGAEVLLTAHSHAFAGARTRAAAGVAIGYHPSLLPLHRGRDAIRWTIRDHDRVTGGSVYHLTDRVDGGPLAAQDYCFVRPGDTPETLWRRDLAPMGVRLILAVLADLDAGRLVAVPQDESLATWEPARGAPPLARPELPEITAGVFERTRWTYLGDPAQLARAGA